MGRILKGALSCVIAAALLCGCSSKSSSQTESDFNIIDVGGYSSTVSDTDVQQGDTTGAESATSVTTHGTSRTEITVATEKTTSDPEQTDEPETLDPPPSSTVETPSGTVATAPAETNPTETSPAVTTENTTVVTPAETKPQQPVEAPSDFGTNDYAALNHKEVQGIWISYLEFMELLQGQSESSFRGNISEVFDNCVDIGLNTVYIHARSHSDAFYQSELFPWSKYASGKINTSPGFDPLEIIIEEAHSRDISVQAWINPLRACSTADMANYGEYTVADWYSDSSTSGKYIVEVSGYYYLNPAYDEVVEFIAKGAAEIVANYDVDGLHIDDYFYPTTDASFDRAAFNDSSYTVLSDFRFANCDRLVERIYTAVKSANPSALFSVSCQGSIENNYNLMYADVEKWCTESGYLDYIVPQIYYGFDNSTQPYVQCLSRWEAFASEGDIPLVVGLSVSKVGYEDKWAGEGRTEWLTDSRILARQLEEAMECTRYGGAALYSYRSIFSAESSVAAQVNEEITAYSLMIKR